MQLQLPFALLALFCNLGSCLNDLNLTVAFSEGSQDDKTCAAQGSTGKIAVSISTVPNSFTCFNISTLLSDYNQNNGQKIAQGPIYIIGNGQKNISAGSVISYTLENTNDFSANANYTKVWFYQQNASLVPAPGQAALRVVYFYSLPNCEQLGPESTYTGSNTPWYESSCQTEAQGVCHTLPRGIQSFAVNGAYQYNRNHGGCETWAYLGSSTMLSLQPALIVTSVLISLGLSLV